MLPPLPCVFIDVSLFDVGFNLRRNQIADRPSFSRSSSNLGGRYGYVRHLNKVKKRTASMSISPMCTSITKRHSHGNGQPPEQVARTASRPRGHHKMAKRKDFFVVFPGLDFSKGVITQNEKIGISTPVFVREIAKRVDRVRKSRTRDLYGGNRETRIARHRPTNHLQAM